MSPKFKKGDIVSFNKGNRVLITDILAEDREPMYQFYDLDTGKTNLWFACNIDYYMRLLA